MAQLVVMYKTPADAKAFDDHYTSTHIPIAKGMPGLKRYSVSTGPVMGQGGPSDVHLVAILEFDSLADIPPALASEAGQAAAADMGKFAQAGAEIFIFETKPV